MTEPLVHFWSGLTGLTACGVMARAEDRVCTQAFDQMTCDACKASTVSPFFAPPKSPVVTRVIHYRTVSGSGPAACGEEVSPTLSFADGAASGCTSILDRVTCEACKKAAPGMKYDGEKARMSLLPFHALELVAQVMTYGARKYSPWNWTRLADAEERYANAMLRHFAAWQAGERLDSDSGLPHLACVACNALFLLAFGEKTRDLNCGKQEEEK